MEFRAGFWFMERTTFQAELLMLEGTDARIHFVHYTPEMEAARSQGQLRTNSFVKLQRILSDDRGEHPYSGAWRRRFLVHESRALSK